jgi:hypothetical protein
MARRETLSGAVSAPEKREFIARCRELGHQRASSVVRRIVLAWTRSVRVRYAVEAYETNPETGLL